MVGERGPGADQPVPKPGDVQFRRLISSRFDQLMRTSPAHATYLGIHEHDGRLADLSRAAKEADIAAEHDFLAALEATPPEALSEADRFERDIALHGSRLRLFEAEVVRSWERRASAADEIGDALFLLLARDFAPLAERLTSMCSRLEAVPLALGQAHDRLGARPVRLWNELEIETADGLPTLLDEIIASAADVWADGSGGMRRLRAAVAQARTALVDYVAWIRQRLSAAVDETALGRSDLDALIALRAFDGLDADDILAIGWQQLDEMHAARREAGRAVDRFADEQEIVARVKSMGPTDFDEALAAYRDAMWRARRFIEAEGLATLPLGDVLEVRPTPIYMRSSIPLAAYFEPAAFDRPIRGVYVVTPSVDGDPGAMREHNWSSIVNTSVHEAYPGHHLQFAAALSSPTPARLLTDAPEFSEGWGMYCEEMMLEAGFEDTPQRRVIVATDAIWRACRIILDIRLHRGEIGLDEAIEFLIGHTGFERPVARAEVHRYSHTPGYNLSYLLGKVLLLRLRADEQRRLGSDFSLRSFHDALLYSGTLPISFHRRLLRGEGGGPTLPPRRSQT